MSLNINPIQNGESGLSVRTKLNQLVDKSQATSGSLNILSSSFELLSTQVDLLSSSVQSAEAVVVMGDTPPLNRERGTLWFNTDSGSASGGELFIQINTTGSAWIPAVDKMVDFASSSLTTVSASHALRANTSLTAVSSSHSLRSNTSQTAVTASYVNIKGKDIAVNYRGGAIELTGSIGGGGNAFPFTGNAVITGSLAVTGNINNVTVGRGRLNLPSNLAIGTGSLISNTIGVCNTAVGINALRNNTSGLANTAFGEDSLRCNTSGASNSANGVNSLCSNTSGASNAAFGSAALRANTTGQENSAFGNSAMLSAGGSCNTAVGMSSLRNNGGNNNTAIGWEAGRYSGTGFTNMGNSSNITLLGANTRTNDTAQTNQIVIGANSIGNGSNTAVMGNSSMVSTRLYGSLLLGTNTNVPSSILTAESTTRGFLPPRMTLAQRDAIVAPALGLMVYNTTDNRPSFFDGTVWTNL